MISHLSLIGSVTGVDAAVFFACMSLLVIAGIRSAHGQRSASGYFMAGRGLPWWSVAGSIYGTNVSLSQIIGMLGIGYSIGFAQSHYELLAVPAILLLAWVFVPAYRSRQIFTLSEFIGGRYNESARLLYTLIIIAVIIILLVGGLYIGSRQLGLLFAGTVIQPTYLQGILFIAGVSCLLIFSGGMHAVVTAENIITVLMVIAVITVGLCTLSRPEIGGFTGLMAMDGAAAGMGKMHLYLPSDHPDLPWTGVFSGLLVLHGFFWTTNQFEVQRVLAARSDQDARLGAIAAGFLKLTIPFFSIAAGVAAAYLFRDRYGMAGVKPDDAFMVLLGEVVPRGYGLVGLILAGFLGAVFSSIYSMLNSLSTVAAVDLYKRHLNTGASDEQLVRVGRMAVVFACVLGVVLAWWSFDPRSDGNFFLVLSKNTSYLKPGIVSAFFLGVLWRRVHPASGAAAIVAAPLLSVAVEWLYDGWLGRIPAVRQLFGVELNFLHRVFVVFVLCVLLQVLMSLRSRQVAKAEVLETGGGIRWWMVWVFGISNLAMIAAVMLLNVPSDLMAWMAGPLTLLLMTGGRKLPASEHFWSALLAAVTVWALYWFG